MYPQINNFEKIINLDNNIFLPKEYFCPLNEITGDLNITSNTYGIHWYNASWFSKKQKIKDKLKKFLRKILGEKIYFSLIKNK